MTRQILKIITRRSAGFEGELLTVMNKVSSFGSLQRILAGVTQCQSVQEIRLWVFIAIWCKIMRWRFITVVWNNTPCILVIRQQRLFGNWLTVTSESGDQQFLNNSNNYFRKHKNLHYKIQYIKFMSLLFSYHKIQYRLYMARRVKMFIPYYWM